MSVITMDPNLYIGSFSMEQVSYDMMENSDSTGAEAVRLFGPPRWRVSMSSGPAMTFAQSALWKAMTLQLKRGVNCLAVWDPVLPAPQGTMRGAPVIDGGVVAGSNTMTLRGTTGSLQVGDWLQIGTGPGTSQLVCVMQPTVFVSGFANVIFEPPLRYAFGDGAVVTWDRPVFYARNIGKSVKWEYQAGNLLQSGYALDLLETFQ